MKVSAPIAQNCSILAGEALRRKLAFLPGSLATIVGIALLFVMSITFTMKPVFGQSLPLKQYSIIDGMPDIRIWSIYQDSKGYMWFGTAEGACRFDGHHFTAFQEKDGLPEVSVFAIKEDGEGNIWFGTTAGFARLRSGKVERLAPDGFVGKAVLAIENDTKGNLWFGTNKGVNKYDGNKFVGYTEGTGHFVFSIYVKPKGGLLLGTQKGVYNFSDGVFSPYKPAAKFKESFITAFLRDGKGRLWICSDNNGVLCLHNGRSTHTHFAGPPEGNMVWSAAEDGSGRIWLATRAGLRRLQDKKISIFTMDHGLSNNSVLSLLTDREGSLWIGTRVGLDYLSYHNTELYSQKNGLCNDFVQSFLEDKEGAVWFGTAEGLSRFRNGQFDNYTTSSGLCDNNIFTLLEDGKGDIWIGTNGGISIYRNGTFRKYAAVGDICIKKLAPGKSGIWIGTIEGIRYYDNTTGSLTDYCFKDFSFDIKDILEDKKGNLWISTSRNLYVAKPPTPEAVVPAGSDSRFRKEAGPPHIGEPGIITTRDGLAHNTSYYLYEDGRGRIWIGTQRGLSCYVNGVFISYPPESGLGGSQCYSCLEDGLGNIWVCTSGGVSRFDGKNFVTLSPMKGNWSTWSSFKDSKGLLWFGSYSGVVKINPDIALYNTVPPPVHITGLKILEKEVPKTGNLTFNHTQNYIRFNLAGLCFTEPDRVTYKYKLEEIESDWMITSERSVFYPYLPPGKYRFMVKAVNHEGVESSIAEELQFEINPPFWGTWWFKLLVTVTGFAAMLLILFWRVKRAREIMAMEAKDRQLVMAQRMELMGMLAAGAVHDLKNLLSVIIGYVKIVGKNYNPEDSNYRHMEKIRNTTSTAVQVVKQILAFAEVEHEDAAAVNLTELIGDIVDLLVITQPSEVRFIWTPPQEKTMLAIHPIRFQQLVMNLCINAVHAMPDGGDLKIVLSQIVTPAPSANIGDQTQPGQKTGRVVLEVSDTGIGMEKGVLEKIFDPL
ncbi:MAG: hypothetical protein GY765_14005, partial [bacterium]|nr:hypothetical protein [bacterium]